MNPKHLSWEPIFELLRKSVRKNRLPAVSRIAGEKPDPFKILISTMISLRTKDEVTLAAAERLFAEADTISGMASLSELDIARLIYPAGFYNTKAKNIKKTAELLQQNGGCVPKTEQELLALPGVGRKTANLVLNLGFDMDAICVDTHVHRISNRLGWVNTETPEQTEYALMKVLPRGYWMEINELMVSFGQTLCTPISPFCSRCPLREEHCRRMGVHRSR